MKLKNMKILTIVFYKGENIGNLEFRQNARKNSL